MKRILAFVIALIMTIGILPVSSFAADKTYEYEEISGTAYISISDDDKYVTSDGTIKGTVMAYVPVDLAKLRDVKLEDYKLQKFYYDADSNGKYEITVLQLYLYVLDTYYSGTASELKITGTPGSLFMQDGFWGHDLNLTYYVNGAYPLAKAGWGSTADQIAVADGDFIDVSMYTSWDFYSDSLAGYHYFETADGGITHEYTVNKGEALEIGYGRAWGDMISGGATKLAVSANSTIYYGKTLYGTGAKSVTTDASGKATITFTEAGTYYLWGYGEYGNDNPDVIVSSPSYAKVTVNDGVAPEPDPDPIPGDVNGDGIVDGRDAIRLGKYLAEIDVEINIANSDVNKDGLIDGRDLIRLKKYLAKMPVELL